MNRCYLGLGSNQKNPDRQLRQAIKSLKAIPSTVLTNVSSLYWTKAWGLHSQQDFCNAVIEINTFLTPLLLLKWCKKIEKKQGRIRKKHWGPRTLDIDILLYEDRIIKSKELTVPHPHMLDRNFVLKPLAEINPQFLDTLLDPSRDR